MRYIDILNSTSSIEGQIADIREVLGKLEGVTTLKEKINLLMVLDTKIETVETNAIKLRKRVKEEGLN